MPRLVQLVLLSDVTTRCWTDKEARELWKCESAAYLLAESVRTAVPVIFRIAPSEHRSINQD